MAVYTILLLLVVAVLYTKASTQSAMSLPNYTSKCGSVNIPYPFGTTKECSLDNTFLVDCNKTSASSTYTPFLPHSNQRVLNISLDGEMRVSWPIARNCHEGKGKLVSHITLSLPYFQISSTRNTFIAVGCDTYGSLVIVDSLINTFAARCMAYCNKPDETDFGSCYISQPQSCNVGTILVYGSETILNNSHSCGYAFLAENGSYNFKHTDLKLEKESTVVLDWAVGNQTCDV